MASRVLLVLAALCWQVHAFSNTFPVVAWSSHRYAHSARDHNFHSKSPLYYLSSPSTLEHLPHTLSPSAHATSVLETVFRGDGVCEYDAIIIVDQPGVSSHYTSLNQNSNAHIKIKIKLHASDLRTVPHDSALARTLAAAPSSRQFPYVRSPSRAPLSHIAQSLSERCGATLVHVAPGDNAAALGPADKYIIRITLPPLHASSGSRRNDLILHGRQPFLSPFNHSFPNLNSSTNRISSV